MSEDKRVMPRAKPWVVPVMIGAFALLSLLALERDPPAKGPAQVEERLRVLEERLADWGEPPTAGAMPIGSHLAVRALERTYQRLATQATSSVVLVMITLPGYSV